MEGFMFQVSQLPPGFRFHPTDQELIIHYLRKRVNSSLTPATSIIAEIDLYKFDPWELPGNLSHFFPPPLIIFLKKTYQRPYQTSLTAN